MSRDHHHHHLKQQQQQQQTRHPALDDMVNLLGKANRDLSLVHQLLDKEFNRSYPDHANPLKLVTRVKKIQEDLVVLKELCRELLAEKQDLIDKANATLVCQKSLLQRLLASSGLPLINESDNLAYTNLDEIIKEWKANVGVKTGNDKDGSSEDINKLLFSTIVQNT